MEGGLCFKYAIRKPPERLEQHRLIQCALCRSQLLDTGYAEQTRGSIYIT